MHDGDLLKGDSVSECQDMCCLLHFTGSGVHMSLKSCFPDIPAAPLLTVFSMMHVLGGELVVWKKCDVFPQDCTNVIDRYGFFVSYGCSDVRRDLLTRGRD